MTEAKLKMEKLEQEENSGFPEVILLLLQEQCLCNLANHVLCHVLLVHIELLLQDV